MYLMHLSAVSRWTRRKNTRCNSCKLSCEMFVSRGSMQPSSVACCFRLHEQMAACSLKQCQVNIASDLSDMETWVVENQAAADREGHLDLKFLNARYSRGIAEVERFMESNHKYIECDGLDQAQPEILRFLHANEAAQGSLGGRGLVAQRSRVRSVFSVCRFHSGLGSALFLLLVDFTAVSGPLWFFYLSTSQRSRVRSVFIPSLFRVFLSRWLVNPTS